LIECGGCLITTDSCKATPHEFASYAGWPDKDTKSNFLAELFLELPAKVWVSWDGARQEKVQLKSNHGHRFLPIVKVQKV
jgi:hypothetical protein